MYKGVFQRKQLVVSCQCKILAFQWKSEFWKTCICYYDAEIGGNIYKCGILISYNEMYYLEDRHNSVSQ